MKKILFLLTLLASFQGFSQKNRICATMQANARNQEIIARQIANGQRFAQQVKKPRTSTNKRETVVYNIPVVVHVVHNGEAVGSGRNISVAQVRSQIDVLNEDYRKLNADRVNIPAPFQALQADIELNFCLAAIDKDGNVMPETGIDRIDRNAFGLTAMPYDNEYFDDNVKPVTIWDPANYLNIWVTDLDQQIIGYAQFPDNTAGIGGIPQLGGPANTDGVVIDFRAFGKVGAVSAPYNRGRTLTHEMGHFFGLRHITGDEACGNDFVEDTPQQADENYGCPVFPQITCNNSPNGDMFMNFMDYVNDECMFMFTTGQKARIQAVMGANTPRRSSLANSTVCNTTALPAANFSFTPPNVVAGSAVTFNDLSTGNPSSWLWNFGGGATPNTSTERNPTATFNTAGTYLISLTATNANGSNTVTKTIVVTGFRCVDTTTNFTGDAALYRVTGTNQKGYVSGHNSYLDKSKADKFTYTGPPTKLSSLIYFFAVAKGTGNVTFNVWNANGPGGSPGTVLFTRDAPISSLKIDGDATIITPPNNIPITGSYFVGITLTYQAGDTVALYTNEDGAVNTAWEQWSSNDWYEYNDPSAWEISVSHLIFVTSDNRSGPASSPTPFCSSADVSNSATFTDLNCGVIATVQPSGASRVGGSVNTCVVTQVAPITSNGQPYVQRYFDITPSSNASIATATITMYFKDAEFAAYNAIRGANPALPTVATGGNTDPAKANLRVTQFHGTSTSNLPNTYNGSTEIINPADSAIVYNASLSAWAVTFDVIGFSGFFVNTVSAALPITMEYFRGQKQGSTNSLAWKSNCLSASVIFEIERSSNGRTYTAIGSINATQARCALPFDFSDAQPLPGVNYYRLKMTEIDGEVSYSKVITLYGKPTGIEIVSLRPTLINRGNVVLNITAIKASKVEVNITDVQGRLVKRIANTLVAGSNTLQIDVNQLAAGTYNITAQSDEGKTRTVRFVKQ